MNNSNQNIAAILANAPMLEVQPQQRAQQQAPFVWGKGGQRVPPNQLAAQRAAAMMKSDYSPVGHWTQGLGRVADNVLGSIEMRDINRREQAASEASQQAQQSALAGLNLPPEIAAGISSTDPAVQKVAMALFEAQQPKQAESTPLQRNFEWLQGMGREQEAENLIGKETQQVRWVPYTDPSTGQFAFMPIGPDGPMLGNQGGGGPTSSAAPGLLSQFTPEERAVIEREAARSSASNIPSGSPIRPPATLPADFDFGDSR